MTRHTWTAEQRQLAADNAHLPHNDLARLLGVTRKVIRNFRARPRLCPRVPHVPKPQHVWTIQQIEYVRANRAHSDACIARNLGLTVGTVAYFRNKWKLKKQLYAAA